MAPLLLCEAEKRSEVLTVANLGTDSTDVSDYFFDTEQFQLSSAIPIVKLCNRIEVLQYLSDSYYSTISLNS